MRQVSIAFRAAIYAEQTDEVVVCLLTISHEDFAEPLRFASTGSVLSDDPLLVGVESRGETYQFLPMSIVLPEDDAESAPGMRLIIDNVMREATPLLRSVSTPAQVTVEMLLLSDPDTVEISWPEFDLFQGDIDAATIDIALGMDALTTAPYPEGIFSPAGFGGLF